MTHSVESVCQQQGGTLSLIECTLIEELDASDEDCEYLHTDAHQTALTLFLQPLLLPTSSRACWPSQTMRRAKASIIWSLKLWWSLLTVSPSLLSSWLHHAKRRQRGPVTSARWVRQFEAAGSDVQCRGLEVFGSSRMKRFLIVGSVISALCFSASITSDATAWWPACSRRTLRFLCHTWSSKKRGGLRKMTSHIGLRSLCIFVLYCTWI